MQGMADGIQIKGAFRPLNLILLLCICIYFCCHLTSELESLDEAAAWARVPTRARQRDQRLN